MSKRNQGNGEVSAETRQESKPSRVGAYSCVVGKDYGEESRANDIAKGNFKWKKWTNERFGSFKKKKELRLVEKMDVRERPYTLPEEWFRAA